METKIQNQVIDQRRFYHDANHILQPKNSLPTLTKNSPSTLYNFQPSSPKISLNKNTSTFQEYIKYILAERLKKNQEALNNSKEDNKFNFGKAIHSKNQSYGKLHFQREASFQSLTDREKIQNLIEKPTIEKLFPDIVNKNIQKQSFSAGRKPFFQSSNINSNKSISQESFKPEQIQEFVKKNSNNQDISPICNSPNYQSIQIYQLRKSQQQIKKEQNINQSIKSSFSEEYGTIKNRYFQFDTSKNEGIKETNVDNFIEVDDKQEQKSSVSIIDFDQNEDKDIYQEDAKKSEQGQCHKNSFSSQFSKKIEKNPQKQIIVVRKHKNKIKQDLHTNQSNNIQECDSKQQEVHNAKLMTQNNNRNSLNATQQFYFQVNHRSNIHNSKQFQQIDMISKNYPKQFKGMSNFLEKNELEAQLGTYNQKQQLICDDSGLQEIIKKQQEGEPSLQLQNQTTQPSLKYLIDKNYKKESNKLEQQSQVAISKDNNSLSIMINQTTSPKMQSATNGIGTSQTQMDDTITQSDKPVQGFAVDLQKSYLDHSITFNNKKQLQDEKKNHTANAQKLSQIIKYQSDKLKLQNYKKQVQILKFSIQEEQFQLKKAFDQILQIKNSKNKFIKTFTTTSSVQQMPVAAVTNSQKQLSKIQSDQMDQPQVQKIYQKRIQTKANVKNRQKLNQINQENSQSEDNSEAKEYIMDSSVKDYFNQRVKTKDESEENKKINSQKNEKQDKIDFYKLRLYYGNKYESKLSTKNIKQINLNTFRERSFTNNTPENSNNMQLDPWESNHSETQEEYEQYYLQL
ncbi:hypothetical protein TTHERM_00263200 (macronuclear) [Tetrahymena thermophila SB210]|uniref:Uncharacterized protein n=1 Tax=Tetrahymena thermophila (strain SB210) TaxID=312017 RepID=Q22U63_TETTS|nr:hypothetical protein TTHERM_00263200 [Tetrahymena thermophila SB210]EAR88824.1 hypothetical protein TTHERM_00263200 [Tetrahymena thermophila SB210]|eukprot:XP_001009069.1 hypothetical protein TTHERM_00263200 [Tetrahymena thermophila SB210]